MFTIYFLLPSIFIYKFYLSNLLLPYMDSDYFQKNSSKDLFVLEKKLIKDFLHKEINYSFSSTLDNLSIIYLDRESKILGYKKKFDCTKQKLFIRFSENKKFLKSTIFGMIKLISD